MNNTGTLIIDCSACLLVRTFNRPHVGSSFILFQLKPHGHTFHLNSSLLRLLSKGISRLTWLTNTAEMCTYSHVAFKCGHEIWGCRIKSCPTGKDHLKGGLAIDCPIRRSHHLREFVLDRKCYKCKAISRDLEYVQTKLEECRELFRKKWPKHAAALEGKAGNSRTPRPRPVSEIRQTPRATDWDVD